MVEHFFNTLQNLKDRKFRPAPDPQDQYYPSAKEQVDLARMLQQSQYPRVPPAPLSSYPATFGLPGFTQPPHQPHQVAQAVDLMEALTKSVREISASLTQVIKRQNKPPVQRNQLRPLFQGQQQPAETRTCFHCQTVGHITWHCPLLQQQGQPQQPGQALPTQQQAFNNRQRQTNINVIRTD